MYLRDSSLRELEMLVAGYGTALFVHDTDEGVPKVSHFSAWLRVRTGWSLSAGWAYAIEQQVAGAKPALDRFFALLDEYRLLKVVSVAVVPLGPEHKPTGARVVVGFDKLMPPPTAIEIFEYVPSGLVFLRFRYPDATEEQEVVVKGSNRPGGVDDAKEWVADEFRIDRTLWRDLIRA